MEFKRKVTALVLSCAIALYGCGGDSTTITTDEDASGLLSAEPADELIRNYLLSYYTSSWSDNSGGIIGIDGVEEAAAPVADSADFSADGSAVSTDGLFSDTNLQEEGVDESDRIKIDGDVLYALETPDLNYFEYDAGVPADFLIDVAVAPPYQQQVETLSAYKLDGDSSSVISRLPLNELSGSSISGMYLYKNNIETDLVLLSGQTFYAWDSWGDSGAFGGLNTRLSFVDANDPDALSVKRTMDIQGHLISSRRVDNRLILVTRFHPQIDGVVPYAYTEADIENNRNVIMNADASDFLPVVSISENDSAIQQPVVGGNLCYSSATTDQSGGDSVAGTSFYNPSPSIISIVSVDLDNLSTGINSACFIGDSETLYVSPQSVYLATTEYNYLGNDGGISPEIDVITTDVVDSSVGTAYAQEITTHLHKFTFTGNGAPVFKGSGSVKGHLGWNPDRKPFRMSEKDDNLRVVTFDETLQESPVTLSILQESGGRLTAISTLPNNNRPAAIGKPGESLYASRFIGNKAYLVTYRITDPLYVLDLSDPSDPYIAGELEIPGYSDYLHPVSDSLLVGLGKDAIETTVGSGDSFGWEWARGAFYQGVKLSLFDVTDPANPFVADERVYGKRGTESPALSQHHSFAFLAGDESRNFRMSIPLALADGATNNHPLSWAPWTSNNLLSLEVDVSSNRFVDVPRWEFESRQGGFQYSPVGLENDRAVLGTNDDLYLIHNGTLHYGQWGSSEPSLSISN